MVDSHIHSMDFSCDSSLNINDYISNKAEDDLKIILTEHMDLDCNLEGKFVFDPKEYFKSYDKYRGDDILLGIEIGLSRKYLKEAKDIIKDYPFDFVLASAHFIGKFDVGSDPRFYADKSKIHAYKEYLIESVNLIDLYDDIDAFAHFDYVARYAPYEDKEMYFEDFKEEISILFTKIINNGIILELNTKRFTSDKSIGEYIKFLNLYKELGGRYVTTGSDAHYLKNVAFNFNLAYKIIEDLGFKPVYFKNRKMEYV